MDTTNTPQSAAEKLHQMHLENEASLAHLTRHQRLTYNIARRHMIHSEALELAERAAA